MSEAEENAAPDGEPDLRTRIAGETAKIPWRELQRFFAQGVVILVKPGLDLVEVALEIARDNDTQVKQWMFSGALCSVSDEQASEWLEADALMWAVVIKPWVLVQPMLREH